MYPDSAREGRCGGRESHFGAWKGSMGTCAEQHRQEEGAEGAQLLG